MFSLILAESGQLIGVLLIVAGAVGYLTIYYRRKFKGGAGAGCGCDCGIPLRRARKQDAQSAAGGSKQFMPVENLADLAARHREEKNCKDQAGPCCCSGSQKKNDDADAASEKA